MLVWDEKVQAYKQTFRARQGARLERRSVQEKRSIYRERLDTRHNVSSLIRRKRKRHYVRTNYKLARKQCFVFHLMYVIFLYVKVYREYT